MSNVLDTKRVEDLKPAALEMALDEVLIACVMQMKPKARERVKGNLTAYANRMDDNQRAGKVVRIHAPKPLSGEAMDRKARAEAIRFLIGRAF